jgi:predicted alpha/beta hydrolase family esterase
MIRPQTIGNVENGRVASVPSKDCDILFLPCAGPQGTGEGSTFLTRYLRGQLRPGCKLLVADMPDPEDPHYKPWKTKFENSLHEYGDDELFVVGHSLGASVALKYLSENPPVKSIAGLFLVSAVYWGLENWKVAEYRFAADFQRHLHYIPNIFFYHSKDDTVVPVSHLWHFAVALPDAAIRLFEHEGHLYEKGIPKLVDDIKSVKKW